MAQVTVHSLFTDFDIDEQFRDEWDLSLARANAVLRVLVENGVPSARLSLSASGSSRPIAKGGGARNARVEVMILKQPES